MHIDYVYDNDGVEVRTLSIDGIHNFFADGVLVHNKGFKLKIKPARGKSFELMLEHNYTTIQQIKYMIQQSKGIHVEHQTLMFSGIKLKDDATLFEYGIFSTTTLQLLVKSEDSEMGLAAGGKMKQKIYPDSKSNFNRYNIKKVTRVFVNIANGTMWNKITNKELPESPLNPQIYKTYGYPWFKLYDDNMNDVDASDELSNIKSIKEIENDPNKPWNCPLCTFENVAKNEICGMCNQGKKPNSNKNKDNDNSKNSIQIDEDKDTKKIEHPDNNKNGKNKKKKQDPDDVEDGDW